jgi:hypothetical protein
MLYFLLVPLAFCFGMHFIVILPTVIKQKRKKQCHGSIVPSFQSSAGVAAGVPASSIIGRN